MPRLFIDPGHGGSDSGGVGINIVGPDNYEKYEVLAIGLALADMARAAGIEVRMSRTTDVFISITSRWQQANAWGAELFLSIHTNASGGRGIEVLYGKAQYASLAKQLAQEIHAATGWPLRRDAGGYYKPTGVGVIKNTRMPALLSESGFIDVPEENAAMDTDQWTTDIARAHLRFVLTYFGLEARGEEDMIIDFGKLTYKEQKTGEPGGPLAGKPVDVYEAATFGNGILYIDVDLPGDTPMQVFAKPASGPNENAPWVAGGWNNGSDVHGTVYPLEQLFGPLAGDHFITVHVPAGFPFRGFIRV